MGGFFKKAGQNRAKRRVFSKNQGKMAKYIDLFSKCVIVESIFLASTKLSVCGENDHHTNHSS